jgi:hypothetical protein
VVELLGEKAFFVWGTNESCKRFHWGCF